MDARLSVAKLQYNAVFRLQPQSFNLTSASDALYKSTFTGLVERGKQDVEVMLIRKY